ncbi:MAG: NAD-dependent epimerase/dehydratase family protein [Proteobacteria bacterium]|nr:NAD-dependent epimerase/dehydratase family protein [Pseudomonadota bacterium]MBI3499081.1 NAD-dependent epimerase/dehydratase family protein [Pseudomonadota bacterium]
MTASRPYLVTGASGFVGAAVIRALIAEGRNVRVLLRPGRDRRNIAGLPLEAVEGALEDHGSLRRAVAGCAALFHVAADYRLWVPDPQAMYRANVEGTRALMQAALEAGVERVVYTSSVATLGLDPAGRPADETTPVELADMIGPYKRSKYLAEEAVRALVQEQGLSCVIVNPSTPVGPRDARPTPTGRVLLEAAKGRMPAYVDTGLNLVHVDDVAQGHLLAFARGRVGERYVLGGDNLTLAEMLGEIARLTGGRPPFLRLPRPTLFPIAVVAEAWARISGREPFVTLDGLRMAKKRMFFSSAKAVDELGYAPRPARQGLADAIAWFREAGYLR